MTHYKRPLRCNLEVQDNQQPPHLVSTGTGMQRAHGCQLRLLDREILTDVCSRLDPISLANFSCTSREMRNVCFQNCLWERLSKHRWQHTNAHLYGRAEGLLDPQQGRFFAQNIPLRQQLREPSFSFRRLYSNNNGWTPVNIHETRRHALPPETSWAFCVSRAPASQFCSGTGDALYTMDTGVQLWSTGDSSQEGLTLIAKGNNHPSIVDMVSITEFAAGLVATGDLHGKICLHNLRPDAAASCDAGTTWHNGRRDPVADMQYCPRQDTLFALHGAVEVLPSPANTPRAYLQKWDAVSGVAIAGASEFMEDWNLKCFCVTDQHSGGNEVIAGAVSEPCSSCSQFCYPSLCCHKSTAKAASLCVFDTRVGVSMVQRYSMHHRSLFPVMACARSNYLFTSHVGAPLAVWDKRQMSHVVYEEEYLGNYPKPETFSEAEVALSLPTRAAEHQGLYLSTDGDQLVGRAENGMIWMWDLSSCLGWQKGGPVGSWMQDTQAARMAAQLCQTECQAGFEQRWPEMLGSVPCYSGVAGIDLENGRTCPMITLCTQEMYDGDSTCTASVVCLSLR